MTLPEDPMMLFSFINMKLRDNYSSLDELCDDMHLQWWCTRPQQRSAPRP